MAGHGAGCGPQPPFLTRFQQAPLYVWGHSGCAGGWKSCSLRRAMPGPGPHTLVCTHNSPFPQDLQHNPDSGSSPHPPRASRPPVPACSPFSWAGAPRLSIRCPPPQKSPAGLYFCTFRPQQLQQQTAGGWSLLAASPASASPQGPEDSLVPLPGLSPPAEVARPCS